MATTTGAAGTVAHTPGPDLRAEAPRYRRESSHVRSRAGFAWDGVAAEVVEREATAEATFDLLLPRHALFYQADAVPALELWLAGGRSRRIGPRAGSATFIPAGVDYRGVERRTPRRRFLAVLLDPGLVAGLAAEGGAAGAPAGLRPDLDLRNPLAWHALELLRHECDHGNPGGRLAAEGLAVVLATHLLRSHADAATPATPGRGGLTGARLRRVLDHLEEHAAGDVSLAALAGVAGLSRSHFARAFRESVGVAPHRHVVRLRVERAKALLRDRRLSIADVAHVVGFYDHSHLTNHFRGLVGVTPSEYRAGL